MGGLCVDDVKINEGLIEMMQLPIEIDLCLWGLSLFAGKLAAHVLPYPTQGVNEKAGCLGTLADVMIDDGGKSDAASRDGLCRRVLLPWCESGNGIFERGDGSVDATHLGYEGAQKSEGCGVCCHNSESVLGETRLQSVVNGVVDDVSDLDCDISSL